MPNVVALLAERREEIRAMAKLYKEMSASIGHESAVKVLMEAIAAEARASGNHVRATCNGEPGLDHFAEVLTHRGTDGGMSGIVKKVDGNSLTVDIGRCDYCNLYHSSELPSELAHALSCGREAPFAEGYDPRLKLVYKSPRIEGDRSCQLKFAWNQGGLFSGPLPKTTLSVKNP